MWSPNSIITCLDRYPSHDPVHHHLPTGRNANSMYALLWRVKAGMDMHGRDVVNSSTGPVSDAENTSGAASDFCKFCTLEKQR